MCQLFKLKLDAWSQVFVSQPKLVYQYAGFHNRTPSVISYLLLKSCRRHRFLLLVLAISPYWTSNLVSPRNGIQCSLRVKKCYCWSARTVVSIRRSPLGKHWLCVRPFRLQQCRAYLAGFSSMFCQIVIQLLFCKVAASSISKKKKTLVFFPSISLETCRNYQ